MTKAIIVMAAAAALASGPGVANDILVVSPPFERVAFADLDLLSAAGSQRLEARIRNAAQKLCVESGVKPLAVTRLEKACVDGAVADGLQQAGRIIDAQRAHRSLAASSIIVRGK